VTPLNVILGNQASAILVLSVVGVLLLACTAAVLDYLGGTSRALAPFTLVRPRMAAFVWVGLPAALLLVFAGGLLGAISSGSAETGRGLDLLLWIANLSFTVAVLVCGLCSPLARHWGLALAGFALGMGGLMVFLALISALGLGDAAGLITATPDRAAFGVAVGGVFLCVALGAAALLALGTYCGERIYLLAAHHQHAGQAGHAAG